MEIFIPNGKLWWNVIPIGALSSDPTFVAIMVYLQILWDTLAKYHKMKNVASKIFLIKYLCMVAKHSSS